MNGVEVERKTFQDALGGPYNRLEFWDGFKPGVTTLHNCICKAQGF